MKHNAVPKSVFRERRFVIVLNLIRDIIERKGFCRIVDLGGTPDYWLNFAEFQNLSAVSISIVNRDFYPNTDPRIQFAVGDATNMASYADNSFDLVHSNSVIEHVGSWKAMKDMAREVRRLAPVYYVQTPNFWFPYEFHSKCIGFHWLPKAIRMQLVMNFACGYYPRAKTRAEALGYVEDADCLSHHQMRSLFPDARILGERFFGLNKSWMAIRSPAA
ncbi:class I SAM-dependent methyltransferase [Acetobacter conturbans]|uniref:Methyltransferase domain-containing protein n=1 Tax=Acetobacter conturbans TaxID=1737472 RepID=A0ABX0JWP8_9PROT|nr:class I SAM-dependent methyltransferase [Acetobacter conturbans]NHN87312.1 methyltransferase domain-containing protein [Acetobacter conturbans]